MARVKIQDIVDSLSIEMRRALADAVSEVIDGADFDEHELFRAFKRAVGRKCATWQRVPDRYIQDDSGRALG